MDEGGYQHFCQKFFLSQSAKKFRRGTLLCCVSENSGREKTYGVERRGIKIFRQIVFVSQSRKLSKLNLFVLCFSKFPVAKKIMYEGGHQDFCQKFFLSQSAKNFRRGTLLCCVSEQFR